MDKRYQVFVSGTFTDLAAERAAVHHALLGMSCIPAGMEWFPASNDAQLDVIKSVIGDCDYYVVMVGGRYGSVSNSGLSFTELEYEYAVEKGLPVLAYLHKTPSMLSVSRSEIDPDQRTKLEAFRDRLSKNRHVRFWTTAEELAAAVVLGVNNAIRSHPRTGWVRASEDRSVQLLTEINNLRKENESLRRQLRDRTGQASSEVLAQLERSIDIHVRYQDRLRRMARSRTVNTTWKNVFVALAPKLQARTSEHMLKAHVIVLLRLQLGIPASVPLTLDDDFIVTARLELLAIGLITVSDSGSLLWALSPSGRQLLLQLRAARNPGRPFGDERTPAVKPFIPAD